MVCDLYYDKPHLLRLIGHKESVSKVMEQVCVPVALVAGVAEAEEGAVGVAAGGARVAAAVVAEALVHVLARRAVAAPAVSAAALERALCGTCMNHLLN